VRAERNLLQLPGQQHSSIPQLLLLLYSMCQQLSREDVVGREAEREQQLNDHITGCGDKALLCGRDNGGKTL
jgi:hypothetical protein